jgi:hypothetical protein
LASQPATIATDLLVHFQAQTKICCLWAEGKGQNKNKTPFLGAVFDATTALGFTSETFRRAKGSAKKHGDLQ